MAKEKNGVETSTVDSVVDEVASNDNLAVSDAEAQLAAEKLALEEAQVAADQEATRLAEDAAQLQAVEVVENVVEESAVEEHPDFPSVSTIARQRDGIFFK